MDTEFGITPLRGYRIWEVRDRYLSSTYNGQVWPLRGPAEATCRLCTRLGYAVPAWTCGIGIGRGCGLYAWDTPELVIRNHGRLNTSRWYFGPLAARVWCWGVVEGWGRIVDHDLGFRAQYMRPVALAPMYPTDEGALARVAATYEVPFLRTTADVYREFPPLA